MENTISAENTVNESILNKSSLTTLISLSLIPLGFYSPIYSQEITTMGLYATSGAVTNWLAIYMLFEKVPFLYGSGVIPLRFNQFKLGIRQMMMNQFFNEENIQKFISFDNEQGPAFDSSKMVELVDYNSFFNKLVETVNESQLGGMLMMFGGAEALAPLRAPFAEKMKGALIENLEKPEFAELLKKGFSSGGSLQESIQEKVEIIVASRLNELTPEMVKEIIQRMIREHLGWLVVWGGVFGAVIGLVSTILF